MMDENRALKDENRSLSERLHIKQKLVFRNNRYWLPKEDGSDDGPFRPFCTACQDSDGKLIRMTEGATRGTHFCKVCMLKGKR